MTLPRLGIYRYLILPIPLIMTGCCNPSVYFSTGTTVGLEATPPVNETPPTVTFGYKRAELALVPVAKPDQNPSKPANATPASAPSQPETGKPPVPKSNQKQSEPARPNSGSPSPHRGCRESTQSPPSASSTIEDAFSVLAVFHLAVNWFGPAKIEQHFATGCAARHLLRGLTDAEEDKRDAEEAHKEAREAGRQLESTRKDADKHLDQANALERAAANAKKLSDEASEKVKDGTPSDDVKEKLEEAERMTQEVLYESSILKSRVERTSKHLEEAREKAQGAIRQADKALRSEEAKPKAQEAKKEAKTVVDKIEEYQQAIEQRAQDALAKLSSAQALATKPNVRQRRR